MTKYINEFTPQVDIDQTWSIPVSPDDGGEGSTKRHVANEAVVRGLPLRTPTGQLKAADGVEDDDLVTLLQRTQLNQQITKAMKAYNQDDSSLNLMYDRQGYIDGDETTTFDLLHTFTRATSKYVFNERGVLVEVPAGQPAFSYDPLTGVPLGIDIEEIRTRLNTIAAAPTAPEVVTVTAVAHTISFYGTGTLELTGTHVATVVGGGASPVRTELTFTPTAGSLTITPSGDIQNLQLEVGLSATSPIIGGEGQQQSRGEDVCTIENIDQSDWWNPNEGTFVVKAKINSRPYGAGRLLYISDGTSSNRIALTIFIAGDSIVSHTTGGTNVNFNLPYSDELCIAVKFNDSRISASINGGAVESVSVSGSPIGIDRVQLAGFGAFETLNSTISQLLYEPVAVSDARLQELSTL